MECGAHCRVDRDCRAFEYDREDAACNVGSGGDLAEAANGDGEGKVVYAEGEW